MSLPEPLDPDDVTRHVQADPELKLNMLENKLIVWIGGKWFLTPKGRFVMNQRAQARQEAFKTGRVGKEEPRK